MNCTSLTQALRLTGLMTRGLRLIEQTWQDSTPFGGGEEVPYWLLALFRQCLHQNIPKRQRCKGATLPSLRPPGRFVGSELPQGSTVKGVVSDFLWSMYVLYFTPFQALDGFERLNFAGGFWCRCSAPNSFSSWELPIAHLG